MWAQAGRLFWHQASPVMAADPLALAVPPQRCQGNCGQYAYWICMPHPLPETVEQSGVKTPEDFDRQSFRELIVVTHSACGVELLEGVYLLEPHASGKPQICIQSPGSRRLGCALGRRPPPIYNVYLEEIPDDWESLERLTCMRSRAMISNVYPAT